MIDQAELFESVKEGVRLLDRRRRVELLTWLEAEVLVDQGIVHRESVLDGVDLHELAERTSIASDPSSPHLFERDPGLEQSS